jgi:hypothetical protein
MTLNGRQVDRRHCDQRVLPLMPACQCNRIGDPSDGGPIKSPGRTRSRELRHWLKTKQVMVVESRKAVPGKPFAHAPSLDGDLPRAKVVVLAID